MNCSNWTPREVGNKLKELGFSSYSRSFVVNEISGQHLSFITEDHLIEMGINSIGHRILLLKKINELSSGKNPKPINLDVLEPTSRPSSRIEPEPQTFGETYENPKRIKSTRINKIEPDNISVSSNGSSNTYNTTSKSKNQEQNYQNPKINNYEKTISETDQLVTCEFCGKKFNADAARRHIPVCGRIRHNATKR